jgi:predicted lipoprotein with Yx(FWY)xxD motif
VAVANGTVGAYLTGKDGRTLYVFTPDPANTSTCIDACATTWPPFTVGSGGAPKAGGGVTGTLSSFARPDGTMQVAYNGSPLYYYAADAKAGDTTGQGVGGKWFIASPTGTGPGAAPSPSGKGKYGY